jgi:shikimate kinase
MLVAQAKRACELFLGEDLEDGLIDGIVTDIARETENIILVGMPGSGKSTVGKALAEALGRPFVDTDALIVEDAGRSIPEIFSADGEEVFRAYETEAVKKAGMMSGAVIATGGGVVTRERNYAPLHQNGKIVFIDRDPDILPVDGRPISQSASKADLYAKLEARGYAQVDALVRMAESYVFSYMQHILSYYPLIRDIHAMNPDAHIVMVGMHNPLEGHTAEIYGVELPLGDVFRYMADIANIYALSYAMLSENKLFVDAFEIDVNNEGAYYEHVPTEEGYAEIAENIWEALGVHDHQWVHVGDSEERIDAHTIKVHHKYECSVCGAVRYEDENKTGDLIGIVLVTLAVSGMGITVLKRREF